MSTEDNLRETRLKKMERMQEGGDTLYPNQFRRDSLTALLHDKFRDHSSEELGKLGERFALAGRIMTLRNFGKSCFLTVQDQSGLIQLYVQKNIIGDEEYDKFKKGLDIGDIIGVEGELFRTKTEELTLKVEKYQLLVKAIRPLPEKFHGLKDIELRYRKRFLDLITNPSVRATFRTRAEILRGIRNFFDERGFLEVETPMMHPIVGGAAARPFMTHHNTLDQDLYLRIAPELYLKRLLVGGLEKVYEVNKNFRNEGLSTRHNPEFTMLEFYEAYSSFEDFMSLTEDLVCGLLQDMFQTQRISFQGTELDFSPPWKKVTLTQALQEVSGLSDEEINDPVVLRERCRGLGVEMPEGSSLGELLLELFEQTVEEELIQPTFVTHYPVDVSPLARSNEANPQVVDRFELFIAGREVANGFSELNDPKEQRRRFSRQVEMREKGDDTAQLMDEDYLEALEFGMPPAAGEGIGIDRLVMILTDSPSIRDVILFPQMRPEKGPPQGT